MVEGQSILLLKLSVMQFFVKGTMTMLIPSMEEMLLHMID